MEQVAKATCIFVQKALKWPKSLVAHVAIATCASAKRPLQARVRWHDASQVAWSLLPETISRLFVVYCEIQELRLRCFSMDMVHGGDAERRGRLWPPLRG